MFVTLFLCFIRPWINDLRWYSVLFFAFPPFYVNLLFRKLRSKVPQLQRVAFFCCCLSTVLNKRWNYGTWTILNGQAEKEIRDFTVKMYKLLTRKKYHSPIVKASRERLSWTTLLLTAKRICAWEKSSVETVSGARTMATSYFSYYSVYILQH